MITALYAAFSYLLAAIHLFCYWRFCASEKNHVIASNEYQSKLDNDRCEKETSTEAMLRSQSRLIRALEDRDVAEAKRAKWEARTARLRSIRDWLGGVTQGPVTRFLWKGASFAICWLDIPLLTLFALDRYMDLPMNESVEVIVALGKSFVF